MFNPASFAVVQIKGRHKCGTSACLSCLLHCEIYCEYCTLYLGKSTNKKYTFIFCVTVISTADLVTFTGKAREIVYERKTVNITDRTKLAGA